MTDPGPLLGAGRHAYVFELDGGEVLRRYHRPHDTVREVAAMEHARAHGFPAPAARALDETDIVMERVSGRSMVGDLARRPWLVPHHARTLAALHQRLHEIEAPGWLPHPIGDGNALLHLDLHPDNVIIAERGPVVIDWSNAAKGPPDADVALTWMVLAYSLPPTGLYRRALSLAGRRLFLELFLGHFDRQRPAGHLVAVCDYRLANRELPESELRALRRRRAREAPA